MSKPIDRPEVDAWRERWESDPHVSARMIAADTGLAVGIVRGHGARRGWCRTPDVHREMLRIAAAAGCAARYGKGSEETGKPTGDAPPSAVASVFDLGAGRRVTTNRNHTEVYA